MSVLFKWIYYFAYLIDFLWASGIESELHASLLFPCLCFWIVPRVWSERTNHPNLSLPCSNIIQDCEQSWKMILFTSSLLGVWDGLFHSLWSVSWDFQKSVLGYQRGWNCPVGFFFDCLWVEFRARAELNPFHCVYWQENSVLLLINNSEKTIIDRVFYA